MVVILVSFWDGPFSGAMLVLGSVVERIPPKRRPYKKYAVLFQNVFFVFFCALRIDIKLKFDTLAEGLGKRTMSPSQKTGFAAAISA